MDTEITNWMQIFMGEFLMAAVWILRCRYDTKKRERERVERERVTAANQRVTANPIPRTTPPPANQRVTAVQQNPISRTTPPANPQPVANQRVSANPPPAANQRASANPIPRTTLPVADQRVTAIEQNPNPRTASPVLPETNDDTEPIVAADQRVTAVEQSPIPRTTPSPLPAETDSDNDMEPIVEVELRAVSPTHFLTKIEFFSLFGTRKYETAEFEAGDYKWRLVIYPNGQLSNGHVSVSLALADTSSLSVDWEINVIFTIFLYNQISDYYLCFSGNGRCFNETKSEWGFPNFLSKNSLRSKSSGYLVDGNLVLGAEVFVLLGR